MANNITDMNKIHTEAALFRKLPQHVQASLTAQLIIPGSSIDFYRGAYVGAVGVIVRITEAVGAASDIAIGSVLHLFCYAAEIERLAGEADSDSK